MAKRAPRVNEGRPSKYSNEVVDEICSRLANGESLVNICVDKHLPEARTIHYWLLDGKHEEFFLKYARARDIQAEVMFDEILNISDDGSNDYMAITKGDITYNVEDKEVTNRSKLRVDTRKWYLSKVLPKKFGEKLDLTSGGDKLPIPIINVHRDNGDKKDSEAK
jgi:hypothetical protein